MLSKVGVGTLGDTENNRADAEILYLMFMLFNVSFKKILHTFYDIWYNGSEVNVYHFKNNVPIEREAHAQKFLTWECEQKFKND